MCEYLDLFIMQFIHAALISGMFAYTCSYYYWPGDNYGIVLYTKPLHNNVYNVIIRYHAS